MNSPETLPATMSTPQRPRWRLAATARRGLLALVVLVQTLTATYFMLSVLPYHGGNLVEAGMATLFALLFAWISVGFWIGLTGFVLRRLGGDPRSLLRQQDAATLASTPLARTAVVMPIYHEPVGRSLQGLKSVILTLQRSGTLANFDFFILSDSRDPDVWLAEQAAWDSLRNELGLQNQLFYRRRPLNLNYKSGNIADFLRRWGPTYEYMIVLDADSLMGGDNLVRMVQLMQRHPQVGILQSSPSLINGRSLFSRLQQFSNQLYGPLFTTGLAAIQLGHAAFWGHNAILRIKPFMQHCGLRKLPGWGLFKGPVLSHDFAEAAYMGRAGLEVWLEPDLTQSYEESPPTLSDELTRDRRWAKGNLQHLWLMLFSRRLKLAHRMAFLNGIMGYVASPLWFSFLVLTTIEVARLILWPINYFPEQNQLFPLWPEWHPQRAVWMVSITLTLLFLPKFLAIIDVLLRGRRHDFGGAIRLFGSVLLEMLISALLAPIRMLSHCRYVLEALFNVNLRWAGQNRSGETSWLAAILNQGIGSLLALCWASFAWWLDPMFFLWSLPVALPLVLAAPIFVLLSKVGWGEVLMRHRWLQIPEEARGSRLLDDLEAPSQLLEIAQQPAFSEALIHPYTNRLQVQLAHAPRAKRQQSELQQLALRCLREGPQALSRAERNLIAGDATTLQWLHSQIWQAPPSSVWGRLLQHRIGDNHG
ncbi:glucans biosynthesis glucosyltransferase MdoH [Pseudomonas sp. 5Ae-yellow]|uniref:glucans biosynthesis glucosyltransferase MdoH n=1 Tax=Pseudomonas sp. 5Ae-yellow TaxID=2759848 RepID=UPI001C7137C6|nr:glucans biosynthesis glucosyltransferase MdoH [Pseudomonas sp. 5Ae-yellow]|tara:strand:+ start:244 stop:2355 length:2112 start_codon:yes stop_codon:yes gene_type:complete